MCQQFQTGPYDSEKCAGCPFTVIPVKELPGIYSQISFSYILTSYFSTERYSGLSVCRSGRRLHILLSLLLWRVDWQQNSLGSRNKRFVLISSKLKMYILIIVFRLSRTSSRTGNRTRRYRRHCHTRTVAVARLEVGYCIAWSSRVCEFRKRTT